jgi:hypothetical protein
MNFTATVQNGKIIPTDVVYFHDELPKYEGKDVEVTIKKLNKRSNPQNRYYWGVVVYLIRERLNELGYVREDLREGELPATLNREDVHLYLKENFNRKEIVNPETGEVLGTTSASTSSLSTDEFAKYIETIIIWCSTHLDLEIPSVEPLLSYNR